MDKKIRDYANNIKLKEIVENLKASERRFILRAKNTGSWMNIPVTTVTGIVLAAKEFCDFLCARYDVTPPNLKKMWRMLSFLLRMSQT